MPENLLRPFLLVTRQLYFFSNLLTISRKADLLGRYNTFTGNPGYISDDLARYQSVTLETAHNAAKTWIDPEQRLVLHVLPQDLAPDDEEVSQ